MAENIEDMDLKANTQLVYVSYESGFAHKIDLFHDEDLKDFLFGTFALDREQFTVIIEEYLLSIESKATIKQLPDLDVAWGSYEKLISSCGCETTLSPLGNGFWFDKSSGSIYKDSVFRNVEETD